VYLLTYTLVQPIRLTRRSTLWHQIHGQWKAIYHQGTLVTQSSPVTDRPPVRVRSSVGKQGGVVVERPSGAI
jgi:hypothetical protein